MKVIAVDCNYVESEFATSYLLVREGRGFFVECNTNHAIPFLIEAAKSAGLDVSAIDGLAITHVHLDHAGGAGLFLREFPNARLYAHPKAARHAIDPSKLIASATAVYGEAFMDKLYGTILPSPADRVVVLEDGDSIPFAGIQMSTKHTRGHANHHLVITEPETKTLFSGDSFGVAYPKITEREPSVILASTSPTDFDGEAAIETVGFIEAQDLNQIALTHYGFLPHSQIAKASTCLRDQLKYSMVMVERIRKLELPEAEVVSQLTLWFQDYYHKRGVTLSDQDMQHLKLDLKVNAQGLMYSAMKQK